MKKKEKTFSCCVLLVLFDGACDAYNDFLDSGPLLRGKPLNQVFLFAKLKLRRRNVYGRHYDLANHYRISVSQMTADMFHLSSEPPGPFLMHDLSPAL